MNALELINAYAKRVYNHTYKYVTHISGVDYVASYGLVTIYYQIINGVVCNDMVD
jgi:hypothetical protein